jgi:hypothetical protein
MNKFKFETAMKLFSAWSQDPTSVEMFKHGKKLDGIMTLNYESLSCDEYIFSAIINRFIG